MKKINEIFYSIQGEGGNAGTPAIFVRFSGCNLKCPFCDTAHENGKLMTDDEIAAEIAKYPAELVILTGGEPSLFIDNQLINKIHKLGKIIAIETNGTCKINGDIDYITLSPKFEFTQNAELKIDHCNELKVIFNGKNDMSLYNNINAEKRFLQPCDVGDDEENKKITTQAVEYCLNHPEWRLSLQIHKIIGVR